MAPDEQLLEAINQYLNGQIRKMKPKCFYGEKDIRAVSRVNFENMITSLEEAHIVNARNLTVFQLYSKCDYFEAKAEKLKRELAR